MTDFEDLDTFLKELCDQRGWSYPGPRMLVERLFNSMAIRDATIVEVRAELQRFHDDLVSALGDSYEPGVDVVSTVQRLREKLSGDDPEKDERSNPWLEAMKKWRSRNRETRRAGYREGARLAFNAGVEFREALASIWKRFG